jgi:hypothetical protein
MGGRVYSVHEVIDHLDSLHGRIVRVVGYYVSGFELSALIHWPKGEIRFDDVRCVWAYRSTIWADFHRKPLKDAGDGIFGCRGRLVLVRGQMDRENKGHMGLFAGCIVIHEISECQVAGPDQRPRWMRRFAGLARPTPSDDTGSSEL